MAPTFLLLLPPLLWFQGPVSGESAEELAGEEGMAFCGTLPPGFSLPSNLISCLVGLEEKAEMGLT